MNFIRRETRPDARLLIDWGCSIRSSPLAERPLGDLHLVGPGRSARKTDRLAKPGRQ